MDQKASLPAAQFASLLEHIPMGVYVIDAAFRMVHVNPIAAPAFSAVPGSVVGRDFAEVIQLIRGGYYAEEVLRVFRHTLETGESYATSETSSRRGRPSGEYYEWRVERILMDDGRHGLVCFFRDISREVRTHQLDTFRLALTDILRPLTKPGDIQAAAAKLLGEQLLVSSVTYTEVETRNDSDYYIVRQHYRAADAEDLSGDHRVDDFGQAPFEDMRAGHTLVMNDVPNESRLSAKEKQSHIALGVYSYINVPLIKEGRHVALLSVHQLEPRFWSPVEIALVEEAAERTWAAAERAKAETQVRESEAESARQRRLYEAVLNNTPDLAYVWNLNHRFIYVNEGLLKMWGKTWEEAVGKHCLELGYEPWHAEMHDREIDQVVATKQPIRGEVPFAGTSGRRIYDYILVPVFGLDGEVEAVAGTTRDVTEIKESERRKDEFLATLAHELRNPLAPIRNAIHVLAVSAQNDAHIKHICEMMERQVSHMVRLVDDLMEISRISRGTIELRREHTTLDAIVRSAVDTSTPLIIAAAHKLSLALPSEPVTLYGDSVRLAQVVANLLNNAAKYTDRGGRIWLSAEQQNEELIIRVRDSGVGISAEVLPTIFDMFVQVKNASSHTHGGLGIGLSLVKHLVDMHGGIVSVTSDGPGEGSEFIVRLPCIKAEQVANTSANDEGQVLEVKKRVLIVDDNEDAASSLEMLVTMLGAEVRVAHDGVSALALMSSFRPEIALLDLGMPVMTGFDIAARARQLSGMEKLKLIALTGWGQPEDRERTRAAGFDHHLVKPAALPDLQKLLTSLAG
ncbi:MAG: ATP-binding protein [Pseudomonadota bacterium]